MKNEIISMLLAFGICENKTQASNYIKNKNDAELKQLYMTLLRHRKYAFIMIDPDTVNKSTL